jgi:hypothetical protein
MRLEAVTDDAPRKIRRPVVSDLDGTREGGLVFCLALIAGMIAAASIIPAALTSFWVWFALLTVSAGIAVNVQKLVAYLNGHCEEPE